MDDAMGAAEAGNYKGVMLCNRPAEQASRPGPMVAPQPEQAPFKPVGAGSEPPGLNPAKDNTATNMLAAHDEATRRRAERPPHDGPPNFLSKHRAWLHDMQQKKAMLNAELQASAKQAESKRSHFTAYTSEIRKAVRARAAELASAGIPHAEPTGVFPAGATMEEEPTVPMAPAPPKPRKPPPAPPSKPKWAMTEGEADEADDAEADQLLDFANTLDYDAYIDDLEVRQALGVIRERIDAQKALEAAADAVDAAADGEEDWRRQFIDEWNGDGADKDDTASVRSSKRGAPVAAEGSGAAGETKPEWDSSTIAGDERANSAAASARAMAEQYLRENPNLAAKHSSKSLAKVIEREEGKSRLAALKEEDLPPLRVVTVVENPKVPTKVIDPSNLPYLHRNPAV